MYTRDQDAYWEQRALDNQQSAYLAKRARYVATTTGRIYERPTGRTLIPAGELNIRMVLRIAAMMNLGVTK